MKSFKRFQSYRWQIVFDKATLAIVWANFLLCILLEIMLYHVMNHCNWTCFRILVKKERKALCISVEHFGHIRVTHGHGAMEIVICMLEVSLRDIREKTLTPVLDKRKGFYSFFFQIIILIAKNMLDISIVWDIITLVLLISRK